MNKVIVLFVSVALISVGIDVVPRVLDSFKSKEPVQFGMPKLQTAEIRIEEGSDTQVGNKVNIRGTVCNTGKPFKGLKISVTGSSLKNSVLSCPDSPSRLTLTDNRDLLSSESRSFSFVKKNRQLAEAVIADLECTKPIIEFSFSLSANKAGRGNLEVTVQPLVKKAQSVKDKIVVYVGSSDSQVAVNGSNKYSGLTGVFRNMAVSEMNRPRTAAEVQKEYEKDYREKERRSREKPLFRETTTTNDIGKRYDW